MQFKYADTVSLTSSSVAARITGSQLEWRLNSIYDIDKTGAGHLPYMYDKFATLYGKYRVRHCEVQVELIPNPNTAHAVALLVQGPSGGWSINGRDLFSLYENVKCKVQNVLNTATTPPVLRLSIDMATITGIGRLAYEADDTYAASIAANPAREIVMNLATAVYAGTSETVQAVVTFVQEVELWDPVVFGSA